MSPNVRKSFTVPRRKSFSLAELIMSFTSEGKGKVIHVHN
jgi:hypothetical protein